MLMISSDNFHQGIQAIHVVQVDNQNKKKDKYYMEI